MLWEREPLVATHHFQDPQNIPQPSRTDVVVVILWSRLGLLLPEDQFRGAISGRAVTGTEWEFEDALSAARAGGVPDLLLYRKTKKITVPLDDDAELERQRDQKRLVEDFMSRWFGGPDGPVKAASVSFESTEQFEKLLYEHLRELLDRRIGAGQSSAATWHEAPFRGLLPFELEHADIFFGRTRARNEVRELLADCEASGAAFVVVLGPSGCGKSSLVKAGVMPDLMLPGMIGNVALCRVASLRPSDGSKHLVEALAGAILRPGALPELGALQYTEVNLASQLVGGPQQSALALRQGLAEAAKVQSLTPSGQARLLVIVDQLEEIFTIPGLGDEERTQFVRALDALARSGLAWVVATMRSDFFDRLADVPALASLATGEARYLLLPPTDAELGQMIREPAREAGLRFEVDPHDGTSLDERIREAASRREALPLLSFVLDELWKRRTSQGVLTIAAYEELGGLEGALAQRAEDEFESLPPEVQAALPRVLRALAVVDTASQIASKAAPLSMFPVDSAERRLIDAFASPEARLFVSGDDHDHEAKVRVAHEALLTHWKRARDYLDANRADLQLEARLSEEAARYERGRAGERSQLLLPRGLRLEEAADLARRRGPELPGSLLAYVRRSVAAEAAAVRVRRAVILSVVVILAAFGIVSASAYLNAQREHDAALIAQSQFLARDANKAVTDGDAVTGALLALQALPDDLAHPDRPFVESAEGALESAIFYRTELRDLRHDDEVNWAAFSPDGTRVVTASDDHTARVWDAASGALLLVLRGHTEDVNSAAFSPDGKRVVTASDDHTARVWDASSGAPLLVLRHDDELNSAAFSPDGKRVVTAGDDHTARIWDAHSGAPLLVLRGHGKLVYSAAFSHDGKRVVTASGDRTARIWDAFDGARLLVLRGHFSDVLSAAFSPDGKRVVTASDDQTARVWDASSGAPLLLLRHDDSLNSAAFSPDGTRVVTASDDRTARVWDASSGAPLLVLHHDDHVFSAAFSPDGKRVVTASGDHTARVWDVSGGASLLVLPGHAGIVLSAAFSPDGRRLVTASTDKTARVWDAAAGALLVVLRGHSSYVVSAAFSPDGKRVVTASGDHTARVWDTASGAPLLVLRGHKRNVSSAAFSPDGKRVVTASWDYTARVWDASSGAPLLVLRGHSRPLVSAAYSPDGTRVVTASVDKSARVWDAVSGAPLLVLHGHTSTVNSAAFSPDGKRVVTASADNTARVWDASSGAALLVLRGHDDFVNTAAFSPDGTRVVTASDDHTARVWDASSGLPLLVLRGHADLVNSAAFSPDGKHVITASSDRTARVWELPPRCQDLIDYANENMPRQLTDEERRAEFIAGPRPAAPPLGFLMPSEACE